ncbi:MAG: gluconate transporter, partial [Bacteroidales bacterium]|nr:gluconate transporter [Bacteroidales bacterium]
GMAAGIPAAILAGPVYGRYIAKRMFIKVPEILAEIQKKPEKGENTQPSFGVVFLLIALPLILIIAGTFSNLGVEKELLRKSVPVNILIFLGHPFTALIIATLLSVILCIRRGFTGSEIYDLSTKALGPAGIIILVTGAGGVLKQILIDSGIGSVIAGSVSGSSFPLVVLAWIIAALVRITQGSATVAMITAAGIVAPMLGSFNLSQPETALIVISTASGSTILSHVNDSGFWIVSKYFGMNEKQTLRSWTMMETIIAVTGLVITFSISLLI